jgi:hypothetical protein
MKKAKAVWLHILEMKSSPTLSKVSGNDYLVKADIQYMIATHHAERETNRRIARSLSILIEMVSPTAMRSGPPGWQSGIDKGWSGLDDLEL